MINPLDVKDMNYLVHPQDLVFRAKAHISGFNEMVRDEEIPQWDLLELATEVATDWTNDWDEDEGFGSSDGTYMLKDFIDTVISSNYIKNGLGSGMYMTKFTPSLSVVPYSEQEHHERVQRMESGI
jgi:hypothetical protein